MASLSPPSDEKWAAEVDTTNRNRIEFKISAHHVLKRTRRIFAPSREIRRNTT